MIIFFEIEKNSETFVCESLSKKYVKITNKPRTKMVIGVDEQIVNRIVTIHSVYALNAIAHKEQIPLALVKIIVFGKRTQ